MPGEDIFRHGNGDTPQLGLALHVSSSIVQASQLLPDVDAAASIPFQC